MTSPISSPSPRLQGYACLIIAVGGTTGAGLAEYLAGEGAQVLVAGDGRADIALDRDEICDDARMAAVIAATQHRFGRLDVLVNASTIADGSDLDTVSADHVSAIGSVMIEGSAMACKHALPVIHRSGGRGAIINIAPSANLWDQAGHLGHALVGGAIGALTRSVAIHCFERRYDIRCNAIMVGADADIADIGAAATYLALPESGYVNGHGITLDDGIGSPGAMSDLG